MSSPRTTVPPLLNAVVSPVKVVTVTGGAPAAALDGPIRPAAPQATNSIAAARDWKSRFMVHPSSIARRPDLDHVPVIRSADQEQHTGEETQTKKSPGPRAGARA